MAARKTIKSESLIQEYREKELSRRSLLKNTLAGSAGQAAAGLVGCATPGGPASMGGPGSNGKDDDADGGVDVDADMADADAGAVPSLVGMGWAETDAEYLTALDRALEETIGLSFIRPGDTVYFKVNCNNGDLYPHSTQPLLITELARRCQDFGASRIIIGDRSFWGDPNTLGNMEENGVAGAAREAGAELYVFDDEDVDWVGFTEEQAPGWNGGFRLPLPVVEADHIINLPLVKTHFITTFTMSLKNVLGLVHPVDRRREGNLDVHRKPNIYNQSAQVNEFITPSLNVLDGFYALTTGGPTRNEAPGPTYAEPRVFIASTDRIAADVTGIAVLQTLSPDSEEVTQHAAWNNPQITAAVDHAVGITSPDEYELSGPTVPEIDTYRELATGS
jgi:uncharacterized protein (DUF362 family)